MSTGRHKGRLGIAPVLAAMACSATFALAADPAAAPRPKGWDCPYGGPGYGMMGPEMMGGGMMGGAGMMGPGMMDGPGAGHPMMGRYGGPGMMGGGWWNALELDAEQRGKINAIRDEARRQHWSLMGSIMDEQAKLRDLYDADKPDAEAIEQVYKRIGEIRQQMYTSSVDTHKRIEALLTDEQRGQVRDMWRRGGAPLP